MPDIHSLNLPPTSSSTSNPAMNGVESIQPSTGSRSPRSSSVSLAAAATINAGIQQDSRPSSVSSRSNRPPLSATSERRRSSVAMNLSLSDPAVPGPGELQSSDPRASGQAPFATSSPRTYGSPVLPTRRSRTPSLGELHQELEAEQEAQVVSSSPVAEKQRETKQVQNRLLEMIRQQQLELQRVQQRAGYTPSSSTAAVEDSTPTSERSNSFQVVPGTMPISTGNPSSRSPILQRPRDLSQQSSRRSRASRTPSYAGSPALRPLSTGPQTQGDDFMLTRSGSQRGRDESAFYQAETQNLTRENQMLRQRIRELGTAFSDCQSDANANTQQNDSCPIAPLVQRTAPLSHQIWLQHLWRRAPLETIRLC